MSFISRYPDFPSWNAIMKFMKPQIFLSHSKENRDFIERLANDLRVGRINVWVDEWEIPPGESFRKQIFEEGVPSSDLFFVYFTLASAASYWVQKEMDAAFIQDAEVQGRFISTFVDSNETRKSLPLDIQSLNSPVLNEAEYERPVRQLIARAWEGLLLRVVRETQDKQQVKLLELQRDNAELRAQTAQLEAAGLVNSADKDLLFGKLESSTYKFDSRVHALSNLFAMLANEIAAGATSWSLASALRDFTGIEGNFREVGKYTVSDFLGPLIMLGLMRVETFETNSDVYYLTELGAEIALQISIP